MASKSFVVCATLLLVQFASAVPIALSGNGIAPPTTGSIGVSSGNIATYGSGLSGAGSSYGLSTGSNFGTGVSSGSYASGLAGFGSSFGSILNAGSSGSTVTAVATPPVATFPLTVTSVSPIGPSGLAVASENTLEGILVVNGQLPFLGTVGFEGPLPTSGSGVASCGCGNGEVGITSEGLPQLNGGRRY